MKTDIINDIIIAQKKADFEIQFPNASSSVMEAFFAGMQAILDTIRDKVYIIIICKDYSITTGINNIKKINSRFNKMHTCKCGELLPTPRTFYVKLYDMTYVDITYYDASKSISMESFNNYTELQITIPEHIELRVKPN